MRQSNKARNRKNNARRHNLGNVVNRVFDSAGPEGRVRGTPQQVIDKYLGLAHDATLSGDRVAAENFLQHAEHYTRLLAEAQREQAQRQAEQQKQREQQREQQEQPAAPDAQAAESNGAAVVEGGDNGSTLVETHEAATEQPQKQRRNPRRKQRQPEADAQPASESETAEPAE